MKQVARFGMNFNPVTVYLLFILGDPYLDKTGLKLFQMLPLTRSIMKEKGGEKLTMGGIGGRSPP